MKGVLVAVAQPKQAWCQRFGEAFPEVRMDVRACMPLSEGHLMEVVAIEADDVTGPLRWLHESDQVRAVHIDEAGPRHAVLQLHLDACPLIDALRGHETAPRLPFRARGGHDLWLFGPGEAAGLIEDLNARGHEAKVVRSGDWQPVLESLTDRQREILEEAVRCGYYNKPRKTSLTGLAKRLGIAKSTLSESLMTIESHLVHEHFSSGEAVAVPESDRWKRRRARIDRRRVVA